MRITTEAIRELNSQANEFRARLRAAAVALAIEQESPALTAEIVRHVFKRRPYPPLDAGD